MSATAAPTAAPPHAIAMWMDREAIYAEYPIKGATHKVVLTYPRTREGLAMALGFLFERSEGAPPTDKRILNWIEKNQVGTDAQRIAALSILKDIGILK